MDYNQVGVSSAIIASILAVAGGLWKAVNHKVIRSRCCGKKFDVSFDVDDSKEKPLDSPVPPENLSKV